MRNIMQNISSMTTNSSMCPDLDFKTRILGFLLTFIIGVIMMIGSIKQLFTIAFSGQRFFAVWYSLGNIVCIASTFFLTGPKKQCEKIIEPTRFKTSIVLFGSIICSLIFGIFGFSKILVLLTVAIQFCALIWYVLSYVPMGRTYCGKCLKNIMFRNEKINSNSINTDSEYNMI